MLYKNKFLIALVDPETEMIMGSCDNPNDVLEFLGFNQDEIMRKTNALKVFVSNAFNNQKKLYYIRNKKKERFYLEFIEAKTVHNDIFKKEDIEFNKFMGKSMNISKSNIISYLQIPKRSYYNNIDYFNVDFLRKIENEKIF